MMYRAALIDPNATPNAFAPGIQYTGLTLVRGVIGHPVVVEFTVTAISNSPNLLIFGDFDHQDTLTGAVVDGNSVIVAMFQPVTISVGVIGNTTLGPNQYTSVTLTSAESLAASSAGLAYTAYVGPANAFNGYAVGDALAPDASTMLSVQFMAPGGSSGGGGVGSTGGTGGFTPPPANQGGTTPISATGILVWLEGHWQIVVVGGLGLLLAPTIINAFASTETAENRLKAARRGAA